MHLGESARQSGGGHVPGPGVHLRLPGHRGRVQAVRPAPWRRRGVGWRSWRSTPTRATSTLTIWLPSTRQENLQGVSNWLYLTGTLAQLKALWKAFGIEVDYAPGGAMIDHSEVAYVIDPAGRVRDILNTDPGPATSATDASFSQTLARAVSKAISQS